MCIRDSVLTARFSDVVLHEADAHQSAITPARPPPPAPIDPGDPRGWPAALDAIDTHFYSWFPAEALHFTISRTCEPNTWLSPEALRAYIKKRPGPTPPED